MSSDLSGKVALVTGAGRGIGREIALGLGERGVAVALMSRNVGEIERVTEEIRTAGGQAIAAVADVADPAQVRNTLAAVKAELGPVDVLINNAAVVSPLGPTTGLETEGIRQALAINVAAVIELTALVLPGMLDSHWGQIVNVSSGIVANPRMMVGGTVYAATKAALEAHSLNLAAELDGTGVAVNIYRPGAVDTAMQAWIRDQPPEKIGAQLHERFVASHSSGHLLTPHDSAGALLNRLPSNQTGQIWNVND
jgi:NAD(P)-dependent dehydrogenase (short-subunit alcohol dehydrogenase family)